LADGGDTADFREIMREHGPMLRRVAAAYEADPGLREELEQEILTSFWRALPGFRAESSLRTFLARVAHNRGVDHVARRAAMPRTAELDEGIASGAPSPHDRLEQADRRERLMRAVRALPLPLRQVTVQTLEITDCP